jgi:hypothetical protein
VAFSPQAHYTDWTATVCRQNLCQLLRTEDLAKFITWLALLQAMHSCNNASHGW